MVNSLSPWKGERDRVRGGVEWVRMDLVNGGESIPPHPGPTALELGESTALFSLSSDAGGGEGRGEESRFYWISPLPNPPARSSLGEGDRRSTLQCLIQWQRATGLCRPATRRAERGARQEPIKTR